MTFGENYFLIEAYAISMTDKLTIVKEFGAGASRSASVLCEHSHGVGLFFFRLCPSGDVYPAFSFKLRNSQ